MVNALSEYSGSTSKICHDALLTQFLVDSNLNDTPIMQKSTFYSEIEEVQEQLTDNNFLS